MQTQIESGIILTVLPIFLCSKGGFMVNNTQLTPSQKIRAIRKVVHCSQYELAIALGRTKTKISRVENGKSDYSEEEIVTAKKFLGAEKAPFTSNELMVFKRHLYKWRDLIKNKLTDEARKHQNDLIVITKMPFEPDLNTLYRMFEIRLVLTERKVALAEEMLLSEAPSIKEATEENQYHFNHNMGSLYFFKWDFKTALQYYLKARDFEEHVLEKDVSLKVNIATCYSMLGKYTLAIGITEEIYDSLDFNKTAINRVLVDNMLATNYINVGQVGRAKRMLKKCLTDALGIGSKIPIGMALHNYGCACRKSGEYQKAIDYFNQANEHYVIGDRFYIENMYWKIYCLIELKEVAKAKVLLSEIKPLIEGSEHDSLNFESLSHLLTINDDASLEFIEKKTIPYLIEKYEYFRALYYCELLENKFIKRGKGYKRRLLDLTAIIRKIVCEITFGEEMIFDEENSDKHHIDSNDEY